MPSNAKIFDWNGLKSAINFLKNEVGALNFRDVIQVASGHKVIPFDKKSTLLINLVDDHIKNNLKQLSDNIYATYKGRANELGNKIEKELMKSLAKIPGIKCGKPKLKDGKKQASGYPDCLIEHGAVRIYADIKSYQSKTADSSLRSFFYQPTNKNKILFDAQHCIIGFETVSLGGDNKSPFRIIGYKIVDTYNLKVKFKAEFNAGNADLYELPNISSFTY
jgi:hypothetical protein